MKRTKMLKKNYEFRYILTKGKVYFGQFIKIYIIKNNKKCNFIGLAISTKFGKAFHRNRVKRLIRENYKNLEIELKNGYSLVFVMKKGVQPNEIDFYKIRNDMRKLLKESKLIIEMD